MSLTRDQEQESVVAAKMLYKDIWVSNILPKLTINELLNFGIASKEARQTVFVELLKRPAFKAKIDQEIQRNTARANAQLIHRDNARYGATSLPYALRVSQLSLLFSTLFFFEIAYHTYASGYPSPEQVAAAIKTWRASPGYGSEFDFGPMEPLITAFPNDGYRSLTLTVLTLVIISFVCRDLFFRTNRVAIEGARVERDERSDYALKAARLTYLRDQLPRESIVTHSLFAKVVCSNSDEKNTSLRCNIQ